MDEHILVFNVQRSFRNVIVSAYYHAKRDGFLGSFDSFYWKAVQKNWNKLNLHHSTFNRIIPEQNGCTLSYENMLNDFPNEIRKLLPYLSLDLNDEEMRILQEKSLEKMRSIYNENMVKHGKEFFRKGTVGDSENHLTSLMEKHIRNMEKNKTINIYDYLGPVLNLLTRRDNL